MAASFYICRQAGITPVQHLCVSLCPPRDSMSYWLELREEQEYTTKWFKEAPEDGLVKIYCDLGVSNSTWLRMNSVEVAS